MNERFFFGEKKGGGGGELVALYYEPICFKLGRGLLSEDFCE